jgi:hypothetical protein
MDSNEQHENESSLGGGSPTITSTMTLSQAIQMGEYNPEYLATFPEWHQLSQHTQLQYLRMAMENRRKQLLTQWAEVNNLLDFRLKPELHETLRNIEAQLKKLENDRERIYVTYSKVI